MRASRWSVIALLISVWGFTFGMSGEASAQSYDAEEMQFLELINAYRQDNGLDPLLLSAPLSVASERHSEDMGTYGFFSHTSVQSSYYPAGSGHVERISQEGYDYDTYTSENVAYGQATAEEVFEAWRLSPSHNTNMLGDYKVIGIGLANVGGTPYWTTDFGAYVDPSAGGRATSDPEDPTPTRAANDDAPVDRLATRNASSDQYATANAADGTDDAQYASGGTDDDQYADDDQHAAGGTDDDQYAAPAAAGSPAASGAAATDAPDAAREAVAPAPAVPEDASDTRIRSQASGAGAAARLGMTTLPDTGGLSLSLLAAALLLVSGGLLVARRTIS